MDILDYFRIIKNKWKLLICILVVTEVFTLIVTIKTPKLYESTATVVSLEALTEKGILINYPPYVLNERLPSALYNKEAVSQVIVAMLKSQRMARDVEGKFNLKSLYKTKSISKAINRLQNSTDISMAKGGLISVRVETSNSELSASIANFYVSNLEKVNEELKLISLKPIVTVIDSAVPSDSPTSPKVILSLLIAGIISLFVGILISFFIHYIESMRPQNA